MKIVLKVGLLFFIFLVLIPFSLNAGSIPKEVQDAAIGKVVSISPKDAASYREMLFGTSSRIGALAEILHMNVIYQKIFERIIARMGKFSCVVSFIDHSSSSGSSVSSYEHYSNSDGSSTTIETHYNSNSGTTTQNITHTDSDGNTTSYHYSDGNDVRPDPFDDSYGVYIGVFEFDKSADFIKLRSQMNSNRTNLISAISSKNNKKISKYMTGGVKKAKLAKGKDVKNALKKINELILYYKKTAK